MANSAVARENENQYLVEPRRTKPKTYCQPQPTG